MIFATAEILSVKERKPERKVEEERHAGKGRDLRR